MIRMNSMGTGWTDVGGLRALKDERRGKRRLRHRTLNIEWGKTEDGGWEGTEGEKI